MSDGRFVREFRTSFEATGDGREIVGRAVPFGEWADINDWQGSYRERFIQGAFARTIRERGPSKVKAFYGHRDDQLPFGRATDLQERPDGLWTALRASDTTTGNDILALARDGVLDGLSVGFSVVGPQGARWSRDRSERDVLEARLWEISVTHMPAYAGASIAGVRHQRPSSGPSLAYWEARLRAIDSWRA